MSDRVDRDAMWKMLEMYNGHGNFLSERECLYAENEACVKVCRHASD